jgi:hypothetical protein
LEKILLSKSLLFRGDYQGHTDGFKAMAHEVQAGQRQGRAPVFWKLSRNFPTAARGKRTEAREIKAKDIDPTLARRLEKLQRAAALNNFEVIAPQ